MKLSYEIPVRKIPEASILDVGMWDVNPAPGKRDSNAYRPASVKGVRNGVCYTVENKVLFGAAGHFKEQRSITNMHTLRANLKEGWDFHKYGESISSYGSITVVPGAISTKKEIKEDFFNLLYFFKMGQLVRKIRLGRDSYNPEDIIVTELTSFEPKEDNYDIYLRSGTHISLTEDRRILSFGRYFKGLKTGKWFEGCASGGPALDINVYTPAKVNGMSSIEDKGLAGHEGKGVYTEDASPRKPRGVKFKSPVIKVGKLKVNYA